MYELYNDLEELCELTGKEIKEANEKLRSTEGKVSVGDIEYLDMLTHMLKSIKTTMAMMDAEERGSYDDGPSNRMSCDGGYRESYGRGYEYVRNGSMSDGAYARGRRNAKRDSMGRYASRSYDDHMNENRM